jgi:hypothetical protein
LEAVIDLLCWRNALVEPGILKYIDRFLGKQKTFATTSYEGYQYATEVNRHTYMIELDTSDIPLSQWRFPTSNHFKNYDAQCHG